MGLDAILNVPRQNQEPYPWKAPCQDKFWKGLLHTSRGGKIYNNSWTHNNAKTKAKENINGRAEPPAKLAMCQWNNNDLPLFYLSPPNHTSVGTHQCAEWQDTEKTRQYHYAPGIWKTKTQEKSHWRLSSSAQYLTYGLQGPKSGIMTEGLSLTDLRIWSRAPTSIIYRLHSDPSLLRAVLRSFVFTSCLQTAPIPKVWPQSNTLHSFSSLSEPHPFPLIGEFHNQGDNVRKEYY
jgi:hypothetical protein